MAEVASDEWPLEARGRRAAGTPPPLFFRKCSFQRTLSAVFLEVFILKGLRTDFAQVRILKGLSLTRSILAMGLSAVSSA